MRNLKKALSLVLAMVMLLGMMVVGAGAAEFKDSAQISDEYKTAAAVLKQIGVMEGTDGYLNPKAGLSRAEGAAIIYRLITGGLSLNPTGESGFVDVDSVPSFSWASGTVAACRDLGVVSGVDATHFNPGEPLTVAAFAKMLLVTLGYDADKAEYSGASWEANVARDARARNILLNGMSMSSTLTREQAAQMALNTLTAETVEYTGMNITVPGASFSSPATVRRHSANQSGVNRTYDGKPVQSNITPIRLCEERFPDLKLRDDSDVYGRAIKEWRLKNIAIDGTQTAVAADAVFTTETKESGVKAVIGTVSATKSNGSDAAVVWYNGDDSTPGAINAKNIANLTGDGVVVEVYLNETDKTLVDKVVVVDTTVATVSQVNSAKETFRISYTDYNGATWTEVIDNESDFADLIGEVKKDDILAVVANEDGDVLDLYVPETTEGYVTYVQRDNKLATVGGENVKTYNGDKLFTSGTHLHQDVTLYMVNGFVLYVGGGKQEVTKAGEGYIYVTDIWTEVGGRGDTPQVTKVEGVLADGTKKTLTLADVKAADTGTVLVKGNFKKADSATFGTATLIDANTAAAITTPTYILYVSGSEANNLPMGTKTAVKTAIVDKVYKYYEGKDTVAAVKGKAILAIPATADIETVSGAATLLSTASTTPGNKYIASGVSMVWIDANGNASQTGRMTITNGIGASYTAVKEGNSVTVIFVSKGTWVSESAVYVARLYDGWHEYTNAKGETKKTGYKVGYYVNGEEDEKTMIVTDAPTNLPGFYTSKENGEAFDLTREGINTTNLPVTAVNNKDNVIVTEAGDYRDLSKANIIDTRDVEKRYMISTLEQLMDMVRSDKTTVRLSLHLNNGIVDTVYVVSTSGDANVEQGQITTTDGGRKQLTVELDGAGSFNTGAVNDLTIKITLPDGSKSQKTFPDCGNQEITALVAVFDYKGQYDGETVTLKTYEADGTAGTKNDSTGSIGANEKAGGFAFYFAKSDFADTDVRWEIVDEDGAVIAEGRF